MNIFMSSVMKRPSDVDMPELNINVAVVMSAFGVHFCLAS